MSSNSLPHPDPAQALYVEGNHRMADGDMPGAEDCFQRALVLQPLHAAARANLGYLKELAGDLGDAEFHYRMALEQMPDHAQLYQNLGVLLLKSKRFEEAETVIRLAVELEPESPSVWSQLGVLLACVQREKEAEHCYRNALALAPGHAKARFNLGYITLRQGRLSEGWPLLDARWEFENLPHYFDCPRWQGEPLDGKSLAIGLEAGQGDMIQFCRYTALAKQAGAARIGVVCHPALRELFATLPGVDEVYAFDQQVPAQGWDFWTRPMSLPRIFDTRMDNIPAPIPYLTPDPGLVEHWRAAMLAMEASAEAPAPVEAPLKIRKRARLRVGLVWKGNANFENDWDRSLHSLHVLAPLARAATLASAGEADIQFVSLQKGPGEEEALPVAGGASESGLHLLPVGPLLRNFADTAAVLASLDLVISVDTAVGHLAGALGVPCWLLLPDYRCDWRWFTDRGDTPWYPGTRLFRQSRAGDWTPVVAKVAAALTRWSNGFPL